MIKRSNIRINRVEEEAEIHSKDIGNFKVGTGKSRKHFGSNRNRTSSIEPQQLSN
jgi:hypothetical protein